ncbi:hypothetical protein RF55_4594 [Lasius niger]|uniref:Uncharacterized protein n=1 Tax=Lasius niger TaxID=67767 RepID=A0A0J7NRZ0_LASNI|nr:hypothetical protein RF55_4594 [Lasius niger]
MNLPQVQGRQGLVFGLHEPGPKSIPNLRQNPVQSSFSFRCTNTLMRFQSQDLRKYDIYPSKHFRYLGLHNDSYRD